MKHNKIKRFKNNRKYYIIIYFKYYQLINKKCSSVKKQDLKKAQIIQSLRSVLSKSFETPPSHNSNKIVLLAAL